LLSAEKTEGVKRDILKAVALRVRVLLIHISTDVGTESVASVDDALDDLQEAESAYLASVATLSTEEIKTLKDHDLSPDAPALTANVSAREWSPPLTPPLAAPLFLSITSSSLI
jgi:hypothetical protein